MGASFRAVHRLAATRADQEDRILIIDRGDQLVVALADGAGGISGGGEAADMFVGMVAAAPSLATEADLIRLLADADQAIEADRQAGETTAVVILVSDGSIVGASCGDSGAWLVTGDSQEDLTAHQHRKLRLGSGRARPVAFVRPSPRATNRLKSYCGTRCGAICAACSLRSPQSSPLLLRHPPVRATAHLTPPHAPHYEFQPVCRSSGTLVVATDGLWSYARADQTCRIVCDSISLEEAADQLLGLVTLPSGELPDDLGMVLVRRG